jgi:apolipoprotein N-acyltransferase
MLRATRFGLSIAVDPHGRARAWRSAFERGTGVMFAELPRTRVATFYAFWGEAPLFFATALIAALVLNRMYRNKERMRPPSP